MCCSSLSFKSVWGSTDIYFAIRQRQLVQSVQPAVSSMVEECLFLWKDEVVFVYTCLYVMSTFMLCKLRLLTQCSPHTSLYTLSFFIWIYYVCTLFLDGWSVYLSSFVPSTCLAVMPCCCKQEHACTALLCPTAAPEWLEKSHSWVAYLDLGGERCCISKSLYTCGMA